MAIFVVQTGFVCREATQARALAIALVLCGAESVGGCVEGRMESILLVLLLDRG